MTDAAIKAQIEVLKNAKFVEKIVASKALKRLSESEPEKLVPYYPDFLAIIADKNVKVAWATFFMLTPMAVYKPEMAYENLGLFATIADGESVIARDQYVKILTQLTTHTAYKSNCATLLVDEVLKAPVNQLPSYATSAATVVDKENAVLLQKVIINRLPEVEDLPPKMKKLQVIVKQLNKIIN